eukprot:768493-Hanusia_phi.AAC.4
MSILSLADLQAVETAIRSADDPSNALAAVEDYMDFLNPEDLVSENVVGMQFASSTLPKIVMCILKRGDLDEDMEDRAFRFLRHTLIFIARTLTCGIEQLHVILDEIFMERNQPFYVNSSGDVHEEISGYGAPTGVEAFEDEAKMREAIYAEMGQIRNRRGRAHNVEGRFINNINAFGRNGGFRKLKQALLQNEVCARISRIRTLLSPLFSIKEFLTKDFLDWFMKIFSSMKEIILNLPDEDVKAETQLLNDIVLILCTLYKITSNGDSSEVVDRFRLDLALKGLRSPYLERRLVGLGEINEFVEYLSARTCSRQDDMAVDDLPSECSHGNFKEMQ